MQKQEQNTHELAGALLLVTKSLVSIILLFLLLLGGIVLVNYGGQSTFLSLLRKKNVPAKTSSVTPVATEAGVTEEGFWEPPDFSSVEDEEIIYGHELITNTALYLGPKGKVAAVSNGMNCQNCHLDAGAKIFGNNYSAVASTYPKLRARSGTIESIEKRVNDCMERSLNGKSLPDSSREMKAMVAYIRWLGADVKKDEKPKGAGIMELAYLDREADPARGKEIYALKCRSCHGTNGEGLPNMEGTAYTYPPLWGDHSYNQGAGLYRLSRFAGYVKANMPLGASYKNTQLSDEEAWDLAAFVNSQPRPKKDMRKDWPDISKKPVDHPFGPYSDAFNEKQHKYGPYGPITQSVTAQKK